MLTIAIKRVQAFLIEHVFCDIILVYHCLLAQLRSLLILLALKLLIKATIDLLVVQQRDLLLEIFVVPWLCYISSNFVYIELEEFGCCDEKFK